jgi:hypothetical protein
MTKLEISTWAGQDLVTVEIDYTTTKRFLDEENSHQQGFHVLVGDRRVGWVVYDESDKLYKTYASVVAYNDYEDGDHRAFRPHPQHHENAFRGELMGTEPKREWALQELFSQLLERRAARVVAGARVPLSTLLERS